MTLRPSLAAHRSNFTGEYSLTAGSVYRKAAADGLDLGALVGQMGVVRAPRNLRIFTAPGGDL